MSAVFITGTDTGAGKSVVAEDLCRALAARGRRVAAMKPVASGAEALPGAGGRRHADVELLAAAANVPAAPGAMSPYLLRRPSSPNFAAEDDGVAIALAPIAEAYARLAAQADDVVVEGLGGWAVPLSADLDLGDLVARLDLPVVLVVGLRLGCINHARLSADAIRRDGAELLGWVANEVDPEYADTARTIAFLDACLPVPRLGHLPYRTPSSAPGKTDPPAGLGSLVEALLKSESMQVPG